MIQETTVTLRKQTPTAPCEWLYQSTFESRDKEVTNEEGVVETITEEVEVRNFVKSVYLGNNAEPWSECTDAEKTAWEEAHKVVDEPDKNPS
jgi:hypothetical protein